MAWAKIDDAWWSHPKVIGLSLAASGLWARALSWSCHQRKDTVPTRFLAMVGADEDHAAELVEAGLWSGCDDGWIVPQVFHKFDYRTEAERERSRMTPALRRRIIERDGPWCVACGWPHKEGGSTDGKGLEIDHLIPVSRGGTSDPENLTVLCRPCNQKKGALTVYEWDQGDIVMMGWL